MTSSVPRLRVREVVAALLLVCITRAGLAAPFYVSSGSMQPTLLIGDRMVAEPFAYGYSTASLPFAGRWPGIGARATGGDRLFGALPRRGDVVVFRSPSEPGVSWVKRVIGLPGDRVRLSGGRLVLNGSAVPWIDRGAAREELAGGGFAPARRFEEALPDGPSHAVLKTVWPGPADEMPELVVPPGRLFVLGDNRDDSADSRFTVAQGGVGLLPIWNLEGRVRLVAASRDIAAPARGPAAWLASIRPDRFVSLVR